jgi:hypothetical protein
MNIMSATAEIRELTAEEMESVTGGWGPSYDAIYHYALAWYIEQGCDPRVCGYPGQY